MQDQPTPFLAEPVRWFRNRYYFRLNLRRFEHLAQLGLPLEGRSVLEVGAGIGDHTTFFVDRGCRVMATEGREENLRYLAGRFAGEPRVSTHVLDLDSPGPVPGGPWEVCYCYGVLYHLLRPAEALAALAPHTADLMLLETVCALGEEPQVNLVAESTTRASQSLRGEGCRPTRSWVVQELSRHFAHVYVTRRQPWHPEFPTDWRAPSGTQLVLGRAVFVASHAALESEALTRELPMTQERC